MSHDDSASSPPLRGKPATREEVMRRYPRLCAHIICESLGYATPTVAASILKAAIHGQKHYCEWIAACFHGEPVPAVRNAIKFRRFHRGYLASYPQALKLVRQAIQTGDEPAFASWF